MSDWVGTKEAASILNVSQRTIQKWIDDGKIISSKTLGGHRRIKREHLVKFQENEPGKFPVVQKLGNRPLNVVLVEDDKMTQKLYELNFQSFRTPYDLHVASSGYEGLRLVGKYQPDLLLTDLRMPGIDGFEMIKEMQGATELNNLRIVVITGMEPDEIFSRGGLPEAITVLTKPVQFPVLDTIFTQRAISLGLLTLNK